MKLLRRQTNHRQGGYATVIHILLTAGLALLSYVLVRLNFGWLAIVLILVSKWRMFAIKIRHWPASIRANAVDIFVGFSVVMFMVVSGTQALQLLWAAIYVLWLLLVKPLSSTLWIGLQAMIAQAVMLTAIFLFWPDASTLTFVFLGWAVAYFSARHFFSAFDGTMSRAAAYSWAFFVASVAWLGGHWLIFYGPIAQPALLVTVLGYGLASIFYLQHTDKLTPNMRRQFIAVMTAAVLFIIIFSDWSDKTI